MWHTVGRAIPGTVLYRDHREAKLLWELLEHHAPTPVARYLMPTHFHSLDEVDRSAAFHVAMGAFARARNHRRGEWGPVWRPLGKPELVLEGQKARRTLRYIHLNGCRKRLERDPLEQPWSTHRDALGLVASPIRSPVLRPRELHAYVSADPHVRVEGTDLPLPFGGVLEGEAGVRALFDAVSAATRTPVPDVLRRGPARTGLIRAAKLCGRFSGREIADLAQVSLRTVWRVEPVEDAVVRAAMKVLGDPRFPALCDGDLRPEWWCYQAFR